MRRCGALWLGLLMILAACEGPMGPEGPEGPQGPSGASLQVQVNTGTILNRNYTERNPSYASIPLSSSGAEPTVLFFGYENQNGVYIQVEHTAVIWGTPESGTSVSGTSGWHALIRDSSKSFRNRAYQVKFIQ